MTHLFRRRRRHDPDVVDALRRSFAAHAQEAPTGDGLVEQVIAESERPVEERATGYVTPDRRGATHSGRRAARGPRLAVAALSLVVLIGAVVTAVTLARSSTSDDNRAARSPSVAPVSSSPPAPVTLTPRTPAPTTAQETAGAQARIVSPSKLTDVRVLDATFIGADHGWALASAECLLTDGRCTALLHTTDGTVWKSHPNTPFNVRGVNGCASPCVTSIRFATDEVGYAFGPKALFLTKDGAQSWTRLSGGADALETLDGTVLRVSDAGGCPPGCRYTVSTSDIGSATFHKVTLPGDQGNGVGVSLMRTGSSAYLQVYGNPAGGAQDATSVLWSSRDDGGSWTNRGEVCTQRGGEVDGVALSTGADGAVSVLCQARSGGAKFVTTSTDGGARFTAAPSVLGSGAATAFGVVSRSVVLVSIADTFRTTDGGARFTRLGANGGSTPGSAGYIGFASDTIGHAISTDGAKIWTTSDAGATWRSVRFE